MPSVHITITNLPQIRAAFGSAPKLMSLKFREAITKATFLVEGKSKIRTPVLTGFLRSSHTTRFTGSGIGFSGIIEPKAKYAMFVHEGTRFMRGRPFLRQAAEESERTIENLFQQALQGVLNEIGRVV